MELLQLAIRTLHQIATDNEEKYPDVAKIIREIFMMIILSLDTIQSRKQLS